MKIVPRHMRVSQQLFLDLSPLDKNCRVAFQQRAEPPRASRDIGEGPMHGDQYRHRKDARKVWRASSQASRSDRAQNDHEDYIESCGLAEKAFLGAPNQPDQ